MKLGRTFMLSAVANMVRILSGLITTKVMALQIGPGGVALLGQFSNFHGLLCALTTCTTSQGLIRHSAQDPVGSNAFASAMSTGLKMTLSAAALVGVVTMLFSQTLADRLLHSPDYWPYLTLAGLTLVFHGASVVVFTILIGQQDTGTYTRIMIAQGLVSSAFSIAGALLAGLKGVFAGMALSVPLALVMGLWMVRHKPWCQQQNFASPYSSAIAKGFLGFGIMSVATAVSTPVALIFVRDLLIGATNLETAGHWQATWRISEIYLGLLVTTIGLYLIPKLSAAKNDKALYVVELKRVLLLVVALCTFVSVTLIFGGHWIVRLLYSAAFDPMQALFPLQLAGDFFKALCMVLNTVLIACVQVRQQIFGEVFFATLFVLAAYLWVDIAGVSGIQLAYLGSQLCCATYLSICVLRVVKAMPSKKS